MRPGCPRVRLQAKARVKDGSSHRPKAYGRRLTAGHLQKTYFNEVEIDVKLVLSAVPSPFTTAMIASEIPAAIRPYSIAVAPRSSETNFRKRPFNLTSTVRPEFCRPRKVTEQHLRLRESGTVNFFVRCGPVNPQI